MNNIGITLDTFKPLVNYIEYLMHEKNDLMPFGHFSKFSWEECSDLSKVEKILDCDYIYLDLSLFDVDEDFSFLKLVPLKTLSLSNLNELPSFVYDLDCLEALYLYSFYGEFNPPKSMENLKILSMGNGSKKAPINIDFKKVKNLEELSLGGVIYDGVLTDLKKIKKLDLYSSQMFDCNLMIDSLEVLHFWNNDIGGICDLLCPKLNKIKFSGNEFHGIFTCHQNIHNINNVDYDYKGEKIKIKPRVNLSAKRNKN